METYKNDYIKEEDETLWELHEIRNKLYKKLKSKPVAQINEDAMKKFQIWKKDKSNSPQNASVFFNNQIKGLLT
ncbi:hypothetical protein JXL19_11175 [bacterium]|nr:hypothetical protein [bacterium]